MAPCAAAGSEEAGYNLTLDFVVAMIEHFKAQKLVHKRFAFQILLQAWAGLMPPPHAYQQREEPAESSFPAGRMFAWACPQKRAVRLHIPLSSCLSGMRAMHQTCGAVQARHLLLQQPSLVDVSIPDDKHMTVCGDTHGQFYDLCNIFELNGLPSPDNPYLFNGMPHLHGPPSETHCQHKRVNGLF
jgi:hypothetical protein